MRTINISINAGQGELTFYVPAPVRGIVVGLRAIFDTAVADDDTVDVQRGSTSVNLITTGATTAGVVYTGTRDSTNKELVFDPASSTAAHKVFKIVISVLPSANTLVGVEILFDDFALTEQ